MQLMLAFAANRFVEHSSPRPHALTHVFHLTWGELDSRRPFRRVIGLRFGRIGSAVLVPFTFDTIILVAALRIFRRAI